MADPHGSSLLPPDVRDLLAGAFADTPITAVTPTFGGFSNLTVAATIGEQACVIKAATRLTKRADVRREARLLGILAARGLPTPHLLRLIDAAEWTIAVTAAAPGLNGLLVLQQNAAVLPQLYRLLGGALAQVHQVTLPDDDDVSLAQRVLATSAQLPQLALDPPLHTILAASLEHPIWRAEPIHLVHGDLGLHNLLWDGAQLTLLDWEWASRGPSLLDLAWLRWTLRWRDLPDSLWAAFAHAYAAAAPFAALDAAAARALMLGQIAMILGRVRGQPVAAEWQRRARWTQGLPDAAVGWNEAD